MADQARHPNEWNPITDSDGDSGGVGVPDDSPESRAEEARWWLCPNGACEHGSVLHDIDEMDDPRPTCTVEGCTCGH